MKVIRGLFVISSLSLATACIGMVSLVGCSSGISSSNGTSNATTKDQYVSQSSVFASSDALASGSTSTVGAVNGTVDGSPGSPSAPALSPPPLPSPSPSVTSGPPGVPGSVDSSPGSDGPPGTLPGGTTPPSTSGGSPYMGGVPGTVSQPVTRVCSDALSDARGGYWQNLKGALADGISVAVLVNGSVCTSNATTVRNLALQNTLSISDLEVICPSLIQGNLTVQFEANSQAYPNCIIDQGPENCFPNNPNPNSSQVNSNGPGVNVGHNYGNLPRNQSCQQGAKISAQAIAVLWALNTDTSPTNEQADSNCTTSHSPLVIRLSRHSNFTGFVSLTSIANGVDFDLLGARDNYKPVQIGWFTSVRSYAMVTLPNSYGRVNGIDQLFGDSTIGPDGKMAANGYLALAKYDGTTPDGLTRVAPADGKIDVNDPIYPYLRLWIDYNDDGVAQSGELMSLADAGIASIDLNYLSGYSEIDLYGNQTKYKSVVYYEDGGMDLIFDLWFVYKNLTGAP